MPHDRAVLAAALFGYVLLRTMVLNLLQGGATGGAPSIQLKESKANKV